MKKIIFILACTGISFTAFSQWSAVTSPFSGSLYSVAFGNANVGVIGGANNNVLLTTDGGFTWTLAPGTLFPAVDYSLGNDVQFTDTNTIYIGSNAGKLIKSTNQGQAWANDNPVLPYGFAINSISFPSASYGYTAGVFGEMSRTMNAGASWTNISISTSNDLHDVYFFNNSTGLVIGDNGFIRRTSSSGVLWSPVTSGTTLTLNKMFFVTASIGFIVGSSGEILKTVNGGLAWTPVTSNTTMNLNAVCFKNSTDGYIVGASGTILKTTDGGTTWQNDNSPTTITLNDIKYTGNRFIIVGYGGTILTDAVTGIAENKNDERISVFPNPSSDGHLVFSGWEKMNLTAIHLYNLLGEEVQPVISAMEFSGTMDLPNRGIYLIVMNTKEGRVVKRVMW